MFAFLPKVTVRLAGPQPVCFKAIPFLPYITEIWGNFFCP